MDEEESSEEEEEKDDWEEMPTTNRKNNRLIKYKESDMVSILMNFYGSQEAFIKEYQNMLTEKFLGIQEYQLDEEIKNIELLKLRFGENILQNCSIIVKDIKDSKRLNMNIHKAFDKKVAKQIKRKSDTGVDSLSFDKINMTFISKGFWPINTEQEKYKMPKKIQQLLDCYGQAFQHQKVMRKMDLHNNLGTVTLSLSFDNGEFSFKCQPIHAVLILYFGKQ